MTKTEKDRLLELYTIIELSKIIYKSQEKIELSRKETEIYEEINNLYLKENNKSYNKINDKSRNKLYEWAKEKSRNDLLNELIKIQINRLNEKEELCGVIFDNRDIFLGNNLYSLICILQKNLSPLSSHLDTNQQKLTKISPEERENNIKEILSEIDPTLDWLQIYYQAKTNNKIIYLNELTEFEKKQLFNKLELESFMPNDNACLNDQNGEPLILLKLTNNLKDIPTIIHELSHYITKIKNPTMKTQSTLKEFSSIFYELYSLDFLKRKGYKESDIIAINNMRTKNTKELLIRNELIFKYIKMYLKNSNITEEDDIKRDQLLKKILKLRISEEDKEELEKGIPSFWNSKIYVHKECDSCIEDLLLQPYCMYKDYPYLIGYYLATNGMKALKKDPNLLYKIKYYTDNSSLIDPLEIFIKVGCDIETLKSGKNYTSPIKKKTIS